MARAAAACLPYRDVLVSVPRQSGKSSLALALIVWRLLSGPDHLVLYAAQNRVAVRRKLLHTSWPRLLPSLSRRQQGLGW